MNTPRPQFVKKIKRHEKEIAKAWLPMVDMMSKYGIESFTVRRVKTGVEVDLYEHMGWMTCLSYKDLVRDV